MREKWAAISSQFHFTAEGGFADGDGVGQSGGVASNEADRLENFNDTPD